MYYGTIIDVKFMVINCLTYKKRKLWESNQDLKELLRPQESQTDVRGIIRIPQAMPLLLNLINIKKGIK